LKLDKICSKVEFVLEMIENIEKVINRHKGIVNALSDFESQAAILMFLMHVGESLNKLYNLAFIENILRDKLFELRNNLIRYKEQICIF